MIIEKKNISKNELLFKIFFLKYFTKNKMKHIVVENFLRKILQIFLLITKILSDT